MTIRAIGALMLGATSLGVQAPLSTDVWIVPLKQPAAEMPTIGTPVNATHRTDFDNQPSDAR